MILKIKSITKFITFFISKLLFELKIWKIGYYEILKFWPSGKSSEDLPLYCSDKRGAPQTKVGRKIDLIRDFYRWILVTKGVLLWIIIRIIWSHLIKIIVHMRIYRVENLKVINYFFLIEIDSSKLNMNYEIQRLLSQCVKVD